MQANKFRIIQEVYKVKTFGTTQATREIENFLRYLMITKIIFTGD